MKTVTELRNNMFDYHRKYYGYIFTQWKWYSYRKLKAYLYMTLSPFLTLLFMKMGISPNAVTVSYALLGILGGIFLAVPIKWFVLAGIILFYFRPFLDWSDGLLARSTGRISTTGDLLDNYGALAGWVPLWAGIGLYVAEKFGDMRLLVAGVSAETIFFYLTPIIPVLIAIDVMTSAKNRLFDDHVVKSVRDSLKKEGGANSAFVGKAYQPSATYLRLRKIFSFVSKIFEHNARTLDLILLILFLELFIPYFISWVVFLIFLVWQIIYFLASFYIVARGGWAEKEISDKLEQIHKEEEPTS
jgi:hypothetical protein